MLNAIQTRSQNNEFHGRLSKHLADLGENELAEMVGELHAVGKERIPAQAADVFSWHVRNDCRHSLDRTGQRRLWRMTGGGTRDGRFGHIGKLDENLLLSFADSFYNCQP